MAINVSKTFEFNPAGGSLLLNAFGRCGIRPTELTATHMYQGQLSLNFALVEFSNLQPNLWEVDLQIIPLQEGTPTYTVLAETVNILDAVISYGDNDTVLAPISRTEYMSYGDKTTQGLPTVFWFDRLISPTITLYPVPDGNFDYVVKYYSVRQTMDATLANGLNVEVPYRFLEAFVACVAWKLAELYAPQMEDKLFARYQRAWSIASTQDIEHGNLMIVPAIGSYYR